MVQVVLSEKSEEVFVNHKHLTWMPRNHPQAFPNLDWFPNKSSSSSHLVQVQLHHDATRVILVPKVGSMNQMHHMAEITWAEASPLFESRIDDLLWVCLSQNTSVN